MVRRIRPQAQLKPVPLPISSSSPAWYLDVEDDPPKPQCQSFSAWHADRLEYDPKKSKSMPNISSWAAADDDEEDAESDADAEAKLQRLIFSFTTDWIGQGQTEEDTCRHKPFKPLARRKKPCKHRGSLSPESVADTPGPITPRSLSVDDVFIAASLRKRPCSGSPENTPMPKRLRSLHCEHLVELSSPTPGQRESSKCSTRPRRVAVSEIPEPKPATSKEIMRERDANEESCIAITSTSTHDSDNDPLIKSKRKRMRLVSQHEKKGI
ncbi:hypothetical protein N0V90_001009 [Kalmusia sp. IMI 367209]|nr:hypothetical protein N0V90_001009 [Kalmusia sp. IMI 367209]